MFWRSIGALARYWPFLSLALPFAARRSAVQAVLRRTRSFSNTVHAPQLVAGDFQIAMDPGPGYEADRALFASRLACLQARVDSAAEAQRQAAALQPVLEGGDSFDLIRDYLDWVVLAAIAPAFGAPIDTVISGVPGQRPDEAAKRAYLLEIRHVAAHLFAGELAPLAYQRRAEVASASLTARIDAAFPELRAAWGPASDDRLRRSAVGMAWVSHPVTAQSGALAFKALLERPAVYRRLRQAVQATPEPWSDAGLVASIDDHVLELMRFRPIFPLLGRDVPRATEYVSGGQHDPKCPAGSSQSVISISAMFDAHDVPDAARFCPARNWGAHADTRWMMFGYGPRQCPARDYALEALSSAFIGLLRLPELRYADRFGRRIVYDGPMIDRMRLTCA